MEVRPEIDMFWACNFQNFQLQSQNVSQGLRDDLKNGEGREVGGYGSQSLRQFFRDLMNESSSSRSYAYSSHLLRDGE